VLWQKSEAIHTQTVEKCQKRAGSDGEFNRFRDQKFRISGSHHQDGSDGPGGLFALHVNIMKNKKAKKKWNRLCAHTSYNHVWEKR
jgi:hypothetical protein